MRKLRLIYRLLLFVLTFTVGVQATDLFAVDADVVAQEENDTSDQVLVEGQPLAVSTIASIQINKWLYVIDMFSVELDTPQVATHVEQLNLILYYFEVLFESCIKVNAP